MIRTIQIHYDKSKLEKLRSIAIANEIKPNNQNLIDLAVKIAVDCIDSFDENDFIQVTNLKTK